MKIYLVGGAVRDRLLGRPVTERDWVVVGATPEEMFAQQFEPVGKDFPVFLHPETKEEYALARTERKVAGGYTGFQFFTSPDITLEEDLMRRDLTINAIAQDEGGELIDPYGGLEDLNSKILRHVSDAFTEDPVRILRVARFAARYADLGFRIADETLELMKSMVAKGETDFLVSERLWKETSRALLETQPAVFIETLKACGALKTVMPEIDALFGVPQRAESHPEIDSGIHTLLALSKACELSDKLGIRLATLLHDLGKASTPEDVLPHHTGHEQGGLPLIKNFCQRLAVPKNYKDLSLAVAEFHLHCHRAKALSAEELVQTLEKLDAFRRPDRFELFLVCCQADAQGRKGFENQAYPQKDFFKQAFEVARNVSIKNLIDQGYAGAELGQQIHINRVHAVQQFKAHQHEQF